MAEVTIRYCSPCRYLPKAIQDADAILKEFGESLSALRLVLGDHGEYVRWEYLPADQSSVLRSIRRRRAPKPRRARVAGATRLMRRLRAWVKAVRETPGGPIDSGLVYRATLRERVR